MQKLLILGANPETAVLVNMAKNMGIYTIVTDNVPDAYAKRVADKSYDIDGMDIDRLADMVHKEHINGIMVGTADPLIKPYYALCKRVGLPCYGTEEAVRVLTNKTEFKKKCREYGIQGIPEYSFRECKDGTARYPVLVKPADGRSGKGMTVCYAPNELDGAITKALEFSMSKQYIIEKYMQCDDVFFYYTFLNGQYYLSAMADRYASAEQVGVDPVVLGATYPSQYMQLYLDTLHEKMCHMFAGLGIQNGVLLIQAFVENGEFYVYDPGFRLQGAATHLLLAAVNGFDQRKMLIHLALQGNMGEKDLKEKNDPYFHGKLVGSQTVLLKLGCIREIHGIDAMREDPRIIAVTQRLFEGDKVYLRGTEQQILVRFHMVCKNKKDFQELVQKINHTVVAIDEQGNNMCLRGLFAEENHV